MSTQLQSISKVEIVETTDGYRCRANIEISGVPLSYVFKLLVPVSACGAIEERFGPFGEKEVRVVLQERIRQFVLGGGLEGIPAGSEIDLGTMHYGEVQQCGPITS